MTSSTGSTAEAMTSPNEQEVKYGPNGPVGLVGVGTMGRLMLDRLQAGGYTVFAYDPFPAAQQYVRECGAHLCGSPAELAASARLIIFSLPAAPQVLETVQALQPSLTNEHILVDTSTVAPETSRQGADIAATAGARYIDAPILGRPSAVGNWLLPSGGPEAALEAARPALLTFARAAIRVGDNGTGNAYKLLNQLMFSVINGISAEVLAVAEQVGIDRAGFYEVVANSGAATVSGLFRETGSRIVAERFDEPTFTVDLLIKDAGLGIEMAKRAGFDPRIANCVQAINQEAHDAGLGRQDTSSLFKLLTNR